MKRTFWVFDIIRDLKTNKIVATCIHQYRSNECCGGFSKAEIVSEGLTVDLSKPFSSKEEAMLAVGKLRAEFSEDLD